MAIVVLCPACRVRLTVGDDRAGETFECPRCDAALTIPLPSSPPALPVPVPHSDEDDEPRRKPHRPPRGFSCPYCASPDYPVTLSKISTGGWIVFAALLFSCFTLFWIGFLIKEEYKVCSHCGMQLGG